MPCAVAQGSPALSIHLSVPHNHVFQAGDTIIGKVVRKQHIVAPQGVVSIKLLGRAKTKIVVRRSNGNGGTRHDTYRSRYNFFGYYGKETEQLLYSGPLHVPTDGSEPVECPFAIRIPTRPSRTLSREAERTSFLPTDPDSITAHDLPPTFSSYHHRDEGYVEYWLEAHLNPGAGTSNKAVVPVQSTLPVILGPPAMAESSNTKSVRTTPSPHRSVTSYKLIPGMSDVELSFKQKSKQFFHTSSVPSLAYSVQIGIPAVIQMDHRGTIPLTLRVLPLEAGTNVDVPNLNLKATINSISVHLKKHTVIRAGEHFLGGARESGMTDTIDLHMDKALRALPGPIILDIDADEKPIDLGAMLDLRLSNMGLLSGSERLLPTWLGAPIAPSFGTYNLQVSHSIKIAASVTVCGKEHTETFKAPTQILGPPTMIPVAASVPIEQAPQPLPLDEMPPPSFTEATQSNTKPECPPGYKASEMHSTDSNKQTLPSPGTKV